jgi:hypothetical protein
MRNVSCSAARVFVTMHDVLTGDGLFGSGH